jgi:hypothetical protein
MKESFDSPIRKSRVKNDDQENHGRANIFNREVKLVLITQSWDGFRKFSITGNFVMPSIDNWMAPGENVF